MWGAIKDQIGGEDGKGRLRTMDFDRAPIYAIQQNLPARPSQCASSTWGSLSTESYWR